MSENPLPFEIEHLDSTRYARLGRAQHAGISLVRRGKSLLAAGIHRHRLLPRDFFLLPAGAEVEVRPNDRVLISIVWVTIDLVHEAAARRGSDRSILASLEGENAQPSSVDVVVPRGTPHTRETIFDRGARLIETSGQPNSQLLQLAHLYWLLYALDNERQEPAAPSSRREIHHATDAITSRISQRWTVDDLAAHAGLSRSQLTRLFHVELGCTPAAYIRTRKAQHFARLLRRPELSIAAAARSCGWTNSSHASRAFRETYGTTPRAYRKHHTAAKSRPPSGPRTSGPGPIRPTTSQRLPVRQPAEHA